MADLPLHMQVKLLRVIQEKTVRPVGDTRKCRWTCACCRPRTRTSPSWSRWASFREDLFYRINVIEMRVPALRERAEDIPELADADPAPPGAALGRRASRDFTPRRWQLLLDTTSRAMCASWRTSWSAR